jgi:hypothetical protein
VGYIRNLWTVDGEYRPPIEYQGDVVLAFDMVGWVDGWLDTRGEGKPRVCPVGACM